MEGSTMSRGEWELDPAFVTVNHGSYGATPRRVLAAQRAWQDRMEHQPTRFMATVLPGAIRAAAESLGRFLNAESSAIAFVDNATTGCNAVLRSLSLRPGNEILLLSHAYGAVRNTVRHVCDQTGARMTEAQVPFPDPTEDALVNCVQAAMTPNTRLAVIDHVTSGSALVVPVARIVALCHQADVPVLIDGAHAPGQIDLDLTSIGADWYVGNCHKWLCAPKGCGFIHANPARQAGLHPVTISHGYQQGYLAEFDWTGTTDPSRFLAVTEAIAFHEHLGGAEFRRRNTSLAAQATAYLAQRLNTQPGATGTLAAAMGTVRLPVADASLTAALRIRQALLENGTDAPVHALEGALWLRLSAFAYNQMEDFERLADITASVLRG
jgi:isopenicillin-N epimerase